MKVSTAKSIVITMEEYEARALVSQLWGLPDRYFTFEVEELMNGLFSAYNKKPGEVLPPRPKIH